MTQETQARILSMSGCRFEVKSDKSKVGLALFRKLRELGFDDSDL